MPRHAHGRPLLKDSLSRPSKRKPKHNAALHALETAERQNPDTTKIRQHRLGEVEDDSEVPGTRIDADEHSNKRRRIANEHEVEEDIEEGSDLEGGTWHTGVNEDDEDSDLDSNEAFGESDEERFADFTFRGGGTNKSGAKRTKSIKTREIDLYEDDDENGSDNSGDDGQEEDGLDETAIDLATAWDLDDAEQRKENNNVPKEVGKKAARKRKNISDSEDSDMIAEEIGETDEDAEDDESQFSVSEDELNGDTAGLRSFVEGLSSVTPAKGQQVQSDSRALPNEPSRFGLPPSKLSAADLLQYIKDPTQRQSLKILQSAERSGPDEHKGGVPGKLAAPLARRQQDRLNRGAAYERSKETLSQWIDTIKQNRRAEHLSFPLADHAKESALGQKQLIPTSQTTPITDLEATIKEIMQESGVGSAKGQAVEDQEQAFEELAEREMDVEEVRARRAELRMARELMFREEIRAKRIKKIKSKAFRRVHRKERDRNEARQREALATAGLLNSDDEREKQDRVRAEERMGARHRESKWAKGVKQAGRATWDEDARAGVSDLASRDEELRRRILGKDVANPDASDVESDSQSDYDVDSDLEDQRLGEKLNTLEVVENKASGSKLGQMAFMQRAEAAQKAENDKEIHQLRLAIDGTAHSLVTSEGEYQEPTGRQKFGVGTPIKIAPQQRKSKNEFDAQLSSDEDEDGSAIVEPTDAPAKNAVPSAHVKSIPRYQQKGLNKSQNAQRRIVDGQPAPKKVKTTSARQTPATETALDDYTSSSESEDNSHNRLNPDEAKAALAASIFAGPDDAIQEFSKEKADLIREEGDQVIDNTLPGWGSWTGSGISKREQKKGKGRFLTMIKGVAPEKRQDAKLDRVTINEKRVKKNGKYLATELPHPFETRQQYERSLRLPIGPEWSTVNHYQDSIKPRVLLKQGTVIRPIAKPIA